MLLNNHITETFKLKVPDQTNLPVLFSSKTMAYFKNTSRAKNTFNKSLYFHKTKAKKYA